MLTMLAQFTDNFTVRRRIRMLTASRAVACPAQGLPVVNVLRHRQIDAHRLRSARRLTRSFVDGRL